MKCHLTLHLHGVEKMIEFSFLGEHGKLFTCTAIVGHLKHAVSILICMIIQIPS